MLNVNFYPFPILQTSRLILRQLKTEDAKELFEIRSSKTVMKYINRPLATTISDANEFILKANDSTKNNEGISWAITLKGEDKFIGFIGFWRMKKEDFRSEIGFMLHPTHQGKGIMNEAVNKVIEYGFDTMQLHSIEADVDPENISSIKLLEKNKFIKEAFFKENCFFNGKFYDTFIYSILKTTSN